MVRDVINDVYYTVLDCETPKHAKMSRNNYLPPSFNSPFLSGCDWVVLYLKCISCYCLQSTVVIFCPPVPLQHVSYIYSIGILQTYSCSYSHKKITESHHKQNCKLICINISFKFFSGNGVRSPKFIYIPGAQLYSLVENPQSPSQSPRI